MLEAVRDMTGHWSPPRSISRASSTRAPRRARGQDLHRGVLGEIRRPQSTSRQALSILDAMRAARARGAELLRERHLRHLPHALVSGQGGPTATLC
jgi:hypothetical protein